MNNKSDPAISFPLEGEGGRRPDGGGIHRTGKNLYFTSGALVYARRLRRGMTDAERKLWYFLRGKNLGGYRFRRQQPIGKYIADFVCMEARLIIELDGSQHATRQSHDTKRDAWLEAKGFRILRIWNNEIFDNMEGVLETIFQTLSSAAPTPTLPLQGEGV